jgi:Fe2+ or Zn2+ uptake regulation protein
VEHVKVDFETELRAVSLRVTRPRLAVLAALRDHPHVDTHTVIDLVRAELPTASQQTIYDVLQALTDAGLARRIQPAGTTARYELRVGDNHHHAVCRSCGAIVDVECAVGHAPCLTASDDHGFVVDEAEVVYWGTCPECVTAASTREPFSEGSR